MITRGFLLLAAGVALAGLAAPDGPAPRLTGFTATSSLAEQDVERRFLEIPSADRAREAHAYLTAEPHVAGTPRDRVLADWVAGKWREYGLERVTIIEHEVLLPYPLEAVVEMTAPSHVVA